MNGMLTERQREILETIRRHMARHGMPPSTRELQQALGLGSQATVMDHLAALERKGALRRRPGKARGFVPVDAARPGLSVPLYGVIPAGLPADQVEEPESHLIVDPGFFKTRPDEQLYALRVRGDSMTGANICDGDVAFIAPREACPNQIVAAWIDGGSTLKRLVVKNGRTFLKAENPAYPPLVPSMELLIQGVFVGLLRQA
jgi:repressor LexA